MIKTFSAIINRSAF